MRKERAIIAEILTRLKGAYGPDWYGFKVHGDRYLVNEPDIVGALKGRCLVIEAKRPGKHSRPGQLAVQRRWRKAGAIVIQDATCWGDVAKILEVEL